MEVEERKRPGGASEASRARSRHPARVLARPRVRSPARPPSWEVSRCRSPVLPLREAQAVAVVA